MPLVVGQTAKQTMTPGPRIAESFNSKSLASRLDCLGSQIHKYTNAQIHKCTNTQMQRALQNGRGDVEAPPRGTLMWQVCDFVRWVGAWQVWPIGGNSFPRCWAFCVFVYFLFVYLCIICVLVYLTSGNCFQTWWTFTSSGTLRSC